MMFDNTEKRIRQVYSKLYTTLSKIKKYRKTYPSNYFLFYDVYVCHLVWRDVNLVLHEQKEHNSPVLPLLRSSLCFPYSSHLGTVSPASPALFPPSFPRCTHKYFTLITYFIGVINASLTFRTRPLISRSTSLT